MMGRLIDEDEVLTLVNDRIGNDYIVRNIKKLLAVNAVPTKQLEEMYEKFQKKLWYEHEDVMGNQMVEMGSAEQVLQDLLMELGCWEEENETL